MEPKFIAGLVVFGTFPLFYLLELVTGRLTRSRVPLKDFFFTIAGFSSQAIISGALLGSLLGFITSTFFLNSADILSNVPFLVAFLVLFFTNEFMHYWVHRKAHEWRWLWKIHRTHHSAEDLNIGVLYRYNIFWVILLPHTWTGAFAVHFGLGGPFMLAVLITYFINASTHTSYRWDLYLRNKFPSFIPGWKVIEKYITLPDTHHAHHAFGDSAHPNGNYAISVFFFDVLYGTAKIPNARQEYFGLPISSRLPWKEEIFWPILRQDLLPKLNEKIIES